MYSLMFHKFNTLLIRLNYTRVFIAVTIKGFRYHYFLIIIFTLFDLKIFSLNIAKFIIKKKRKQKILKDSYANTSIIVTGQRHVNYKIAT